MLLLWAFIHILTSLPLLTFSAQAKNICYFPDAQTVDVNGYACNPTAQFSSCCSRNDSCVAGGLCFGNFGFLYRQSCTDPTFKDPSCPQACVNLLQNRLVNVLPCDADNGSFCCFEPSQGSCCNNQFGLIPGTITVLRAGQATPPIESSSPTSPSTNLTTATATPSATCGPSSAIPTNCPKHSPSTTAVGVAVGVPLGVALLAALAFIAIYERRRWQWPKRNEIGVMSQIQDNEDVVVQPRTELDPNNIHELTSEGRHG